MGKVINANISNQLDIKNWLNEGEKNALSFYTGLVTGGVNLG